MKTLISKPTIAVVVWALALGTSNAAVITFDTVVTGQTSFGLDGDGDGINDVIFSTTDPAGFNTTISPGVNQIYINEPGLEGTSTLNPDLRVDFLNGGVGPLAFGFALNSSMANSSYFANIRLFNAAGTEIGTASVEGAYASTPSGTSSFPEGRVTVNFPGVASYGLFNFESQFGRYTIDNFEGTFGSTEIPQIPEPQTAALLGLGLAALVVARRRRVQNRNRRLSRLEPCLVRFCCRLRMVA